MAHLEFGGTVNPYPARGADYAHHSTDCPPGFEKLMASLRCVLMNFLSNSLFAYWPKTSFMKWLFLGKIDEIWQKSTLCLARNECNTKCG